MEVGAIMSKRVAAVGPRDTLVKVARLMKEEDVGCVLVLDEHRKPVGIVTDRDVIVRGLAVGRNPETEAVEAVMTKSPFSTRASEPVMLAARRMADLLVRRLPVVDEEGRAIGLVSVDDLLTILITELSNAATAIVGSSKLVR